METKVITSTTRREISRLYRKTWETRSCMVELQLEAVELIT